MYYVTRSKLQTYCLIDNAKHAIFLFLSFFLFFSVFVCLFCCCCFAFCFCFQVIKTVFVLFSVLFQNADIHVYFRSFSSPHTIRVVHYIRQAGRQDNLDGGPSLTWSARGWRQREHRLTKIPDWGHKASPVASVVSSDTLFGLASLHAELSIVSERCDLETLDAITVTVTRHLGTRNAITSD